MKRTIRIILPVMLFLLIITSSVVSVGHKSDTGEVTIRNGAEAAERAEASEYLSFLGIVPPNQELEAIDFTVEVLGGRSERLSDYRGKVVFLNFWATWCGPCRSEVGEIDSLHETLKGEDFMIMALSIQEEENKVSRFMQSFGVDFPVYLDSDGAVASRYGVTGIPTTYIIDPDGKIVGRAIGPREWGSRESVELMRSLMN